MTSDEQVHVHTFFGGGDAAAATAVRLRRYNLLDFTDRLASTPNFPGPFLGEGVVPMHFVGNG